MSNSFYSCWTASTLALAFFFWKKTIFAIERSSTYSQWAQLNNFKINRKTQTNTKKKQKIILCPSLSEQVNNFGYGSQLLNFFFQFYLKWIAIVKLCLMFFFRFSFAKALNRSVYKKIKKKYKKIQSLNGHGIFFLCCGYYTYFSFLKKRNKNFCFA